MSQDHTATVELPQELPGIYPAFPIKPGNELYAPANGLTKREYIATALLSGLLAQRTVRAKRFAALVGEAIEHTDELLYQLANAPTRD